VTEVAGQKPVEIAESPTLVSVEGKRLSIQKVNPASIDEAAEIRTPALSGNHSRDSLKDSPTLMEETNEPTNESPLLADTKRTKIVTDAAAVVEKAVEIIKESPCLSKRSANEVLSRKWQR
jgi:hypothetical protein